MNLSKGTEHNLLELWVDNIDIKPYYKIRAGIVKEGMAVKINQYSLENALTQMIDDYGKEELIKRINELD